MISMHVMLQVLEQNVKWKAAVMQTTLHSAGTAVLPLRKSLMKIIAALFAAPSQVGSFLSHFVQAHKASSPPIRCLRLPTLHDST